MRYVLCLLDPADGGLPENLRRQYDVLPRKRGLAFTWRSFDHAAVLIAWDDPWGEPLVAQDGEWFAIGVVRLDNRLEVERWTGLDRSDLASLTDLALVLKVVAATGAKRIRDVLGDFGFVAWNGTTRTAIAAADALGVKKLFYAERNGTVAFATRAEALVLEERYEAQYLAELIALCPPTRGLTAFEGIRRLPAGCTASFAAGDFMERTYWSPEEFDTMPFTPALEREAPEQLRELLSESVRQRLTGNGDTWAQLSGGLDSSSIVSVAQWLEQRGDVTHGLAGTVTYVDWQGTDADEREYVAAVVDRWEVRNEAIIDAPLWLDDQFPIGRLDQPRRSLAFSPRERRLCSLVRSAGGRVLLTGFGSDELFTGTSIFFADRLARGRIISALRELAQWAARGRTSFWQLTYENAFLPLLPPRFHHARSIEFGRLLPWISERAAARYGLRRHAYSVTGNSGRLGRKYVDSLRRSLRAITMDLDPGLIGDELEVRYPFLTRPIVELGLQLAPEVCARPHERKWVLRQAMRNVLPESVRTRVGKGASTDVLVNSLTVQRHQLLPLAHEMVLAELGVVDEDQFRAAFELAPVLKQSDDDMCTDVQSTLTVEAWLRIRRDGWPREVPAKQL